jgi:hypothetical protein
MPNPRSAAGHIQQITWMVNENGAAMSDPNAGISCAESRVATRQLGQRSRQLKQMAASSINAVVYFAELTLQARTV